MTQNVKFYAFFHNDEDPHLDPSQNIVTRRLTYINSRLTKDIKQFKRNYDFLPAGHYKYANKILLFQKTDREKNVLTNHHRAEEPSKQPWLNFKEKKSETFFLQTRTAHSTKPCNNLTKCHRRTGCCTWQGSSTGTRTHVGRVPQGEQWPEKQLNLKSVVGFMQGNNFCSFYRLL